MLVVNSLELRAQARVRAACGSGQRQLATVGVGPRQWVVGKRPVGVRGLRPRGWVAPAPDMPS